jgi:type I restriction enzyme S subunit
LVLSDLRPFRSLVAFAIGGGWGKGEEFEDSVAVRVIRGTDIANIALGMYSQVPRRFEAQNKARKRYLQPGDILLEISGGSPTTGQTTGRSMLITPRTLESLGEPVIPASFCRLVRINTSVADPRYAYYALQDMYNSGRAGEYEHQSTGISNFQFQHFLNAETIRLPSRREQETIAEILAHLDHKIELNRRMNVTLESIARARFSHYMATCPPRQYVTLGSLLETIETGKRPKGGVKGITSGVPSIGAESITRIGEFDFSKTKYVPQQFFEEMNRGVVEDFDVLLYKDGGKPGVYEPHVSMFGLGFPFETFCINEHVYRLRVGHPYSQAILYYWLTYEEALEEMRRKGSGVAVPGLNSNAVKSLAFPILPGSHIRSLSAFLTDVNTRILLSALQARTLACLRDALLPKLMAGELRIPEAECFVSEAV